MSSELKKDIKTNWRWYLCALLFVATTVNYLDRQVLSLTWKDFIAPEFHWSDTDYGMITGFFSLFYAAVSLFAGKGIDKLGTKKGYLIAILVWSTGACLHAGCGWVTMQIEGVPSKEALIAIKQGSALALSVSTISVYLFLACRIVLAVGESGNFPSAVKVTAEYFPKKDRAFATAIFNSGASVGALAAPATIPFIAKAWGWESAFIIIGALGYIWMYFWIKWYDKPEQSKHVNAQELAYIQQDDEENATGNKDAKEEKSIPMLKCFTYKQTWEFITGKFFTDGVWWFYLFWAPAYFSDVYNYPSASKEGATLIFILYFIVTVLSIFGGYLPKVFVEKKHMEPYSGRMKAMLIFAFFPLFALFAQPLGQYSAIFPAIIIGLAGAGHQSWSANLYSTIGDMFPKSTVATITGVGIMAGGIGSYLINQGSGILFDYAGRMGSQFTFLGFEGKPAGYMIVFCICSVAYLIAWSIMKALVPKYKKIEV